MAKRVRSRTPSHTKLEMLQRITKVSKPTIKMILDTALLLDLVDLEKTGEIHNPLVTLEKRGDVVVLKLGDTAHRMMTGSLDMTTILNYLSHAVK